MLVAKRAVGSVAGNYTTAEEGIMLQGFVGTLVFLFHDIFITDI